MSALATPILRHLRSHLPVKSFRASAATAAKVFALAHSLNYFNIACASTAKNVADTGKKTLDYIRLGANGSRADGVLGSCTYNYTENKDVQTLTDIFQGIADTLDEGRKLDYLHRFDRLGLDAEMESPSPVKYPTATRSKCGPSRRPCARSPTTPVSCNVCAPGPMRCSRWFPRRRNLCHGKSELFHTLNGRGFMLFCARFRFERARL